MIPRKILLALPVLALLAAGCSDSAAPPAETTTTAPAETGPGPSLGPEGVVE